MISMIVFLNDEELGKLGYLFNLKKKKKQKLKQEYESKYQVKFCSFVIEIYDSKFSGSENNQRIECNS